MKTFILIVMVAALGLTVGLLLENSWAGGVSVGINIGIPAPVGVYMAPAYYPPAYIYPPPVYGPAVVVAGSPYYRYYGAPYYKHHPRYYHKYHPHAFKGGKGKKPF
jgi:hypothetical protein